MDEACFHCQEGCFHCQENKKVIIRILKGVHGIHVIEFTYR